MKTFETEQDYKTALNKLNCYNDAVTSYCKEHKTNGIPCEITKTFPFANEVDNDLRSAIEVYDFINNPPAKYFIYISESKNIATTWTGQKLGSVIWGNSYRSNFGDKRQSVTIRAINGKMYYGTYFKDAGDYARITMLKTKSN